MCFGFIDLVKLCKQTAGEVIVFLLAPSHQTLTCGSVSPPMEGTQMVVSMQGGPEIIRGTGLMSAARRRESKGNSRCLREATIYLTK